LAEVQQPDRALVAAEPDRGTAGGRVEHRQRAPVAGQPARVRTEQHDVRRDRRREQVLAVLSGVAGLLGAGDDERGGAGEVRVLGPIACMEPLDAVAADLRERLLAGAGEGEEAVAGLPARIRALVDREAGVLDEARREQLTTRIAERAFGMGPLEPLLADPAVEEVMVSGTAPAW